MSDTPLLEIRDLSKSFGSVQALTDVDFEVRTGEVMALVGDNGAGKSTLIKCIAGIHGYDSGEIFFDGQDVHIHGPKDAAKLGIEVVYQDLALCDNLDVVQNMYLGREIRDFLFRLKEPAMEQRTVETLKGLRVTTIKSIRQAVATLSGGQRQSVAVARAVMWNSKLVILDEPTAALGVAQTEQVLELVRRLAEQGLAVVLISHNLHDIFETATRITVLRLGRNVGIYERATTTQQEVVQAITAGVPTKVVRNLGDGAGDRRVTSDAEIVAPGIGLPEGDEAEQERGHLAASGRQHQVGKPRCASGRPRRDPHRRVLQLHRHELLHRRELRERHPADGRGDDDRVRRRLRAAPRRDRPLDRLPERHRRGDRGHDAARGRAQLPGMARDPDRARPSSR